MEPADYTEYSRKIGQESFQTLDKVFKSIEYRRMDQETKEKVIKDVFDYARENAKADYAEKKRLPINIGSVVEKVDTAKNSGILVGLYFVATQKIYDTHNDIDPKTGETIAKEVGNLKTRKTKVVEYVDILGLSLEQKDALMKLNSYKEYLRN